MFNKIFNKYPMTALAIFAFIIIIVSIPVIVSKQLEPSVTVTKPVVQDYYLLKCHEVDGSVSTWNKDGDEGYYMFFYDNSIAIKNSDKKIIKFYSDTYKCSADYKISKSFPQI